MPKKTLAVTLAVLVLTLLVPVFNVSGVIDLEWMDNLTLGVFGFVWAVVLMFSVGELAILAIGDAKA